LARNCRMAPPVFATLAILVLCAVSRVAAAAAIPPRSAPASASVLIGDSIVPLNGPWKFTLGDSPLDPSTHQPLWAQPGFDDSHWETLDLSPKPGWSDPYNGDPRYVPGWTATGHPGYIGWAWYRLAVPVAPEDGKKLALGAPIYVDDGYQAFANGQLIGAFGRFSDSGKPPKVSTTGPAAFPVPTAVGSAVHAAPGTQTIAFRVWMGPMGATHSPYAGGLHYAPVLGEAGAIEAQTRLAWLELALQSGYAPFEAVLLFLLGAVAAGLLVFDRSDRAYLWLAGVLLFTAFSDVALTVFTLTQRLTLRTYFMFFDVFSNPLELCGWIMVWWFWFHLKRPGWIPRLVAALMLLYMVTKAIGGEFFYGFIPHPIEGAFNATSVVVRLLFLPIFIYIVALGIRKEGIEGWFVLPAVIPLMISQFASELIVLNLPVKWSPLGITIFIGQVSNLISAAAISLLMLRRLQLSLRQQKERALDLKQAHEMQRMLIPEPMPELHGFRLTSAYRPALEVGGDFFQIVPRANGAMELVLGDVSGKGLTAAMAVSMIMGTIRVLSDESIGPAAFLHELNRRVRGQLQGGFATCIALWIAPDGTCTLASAGHPAPFLNDVEMELPGDLPLGLDVSGDYEEKTFMLHIGDCLTLYTDGLPEARNDSGELYGFERLKTLIATQPSAQVAAEVAHMFGQDDDVTVLTLTRLVPLAVPIPLSAAVPTTHAERAALNPLPATSSSQ
jgi:Stage II sporulation protein E (SpoIIE)